jgi:hypothetical protein
MILKIKGNHGDTIIIMIWCISCLGLLPILHYASYLENQDSHQRNLFHQLPRPNQECSFIDSFSSMYSWLMLPGRLHFTSNDNNSHLVLALLSDPLWILGSNHGCKTLQVPARQCDSASWPGCTMQPGYIIPSHCIQHASTGPAACSRLLDAICQPDTNNLNFLTPGPQQPISSPNFQVPQFTVQLHTPIALYYDCSAAIQIQWLVNEPPTWILKASPYTTSIHGCIRAWYCTSNSTA